MAGRPSEKRTSEANHAGQQRGTRDKIIATAERMFADRGFDGTSLRGIIREANVNAAAIHYHFGSKEALFVAVMDRLVPPLDSERLKRLDKLEGRNRTPTLIALVEAFFEPYFELARSPEHGEQWARLIWRSRLEPGSHWQNTYARSSVIGRYLKAFCRAVPAVSERELAYRLHFMMGAVDHAIVDDRTLAFLGQDVPGFREDPDKVQMRLMSYITTIFKMVPQG